MEERSLLTWLAFHAAREADRPFIIDKNESITLSYRQALQIASSITTFIEARGLPGHGRLVLFTKNHWLYLPLLVACAHSGVTLVPLDPDLHKKDVEFVLNTVNPHLILGAPVHFDVPDTIDQLSIPALLNILSAVPALDVHRAANASEPCLLIYTSGSSGNAKIVMLTEFALVADGSRIAHRYGLSSAHRLYGVLPFFHMNAVMITGCAPLTAGATVVIGPLFNAESAPGFWEQVCSSDVTVVSLVPPIMSALLMVRPTDKQTDIGRLQFAYCGAAPLSADLWKRFEQAFQIPVYQGYGLTETSCWVVTSPPDRPQTYDSAGVPLPGCEISIDVDTGLGLDWESTLGSDRHPQAELERRSASRFDTGEILVRGPMLMAGYFKNKHLTARSIREDGFLRTGDIGFVDEAGYLHIIGRKKEIIIKNGRNIIPDEIDAVLSRHPSVLESKTIGIPHDLVGEQVVSAVRLVARATTSISELREFAKENLTTYKCPDRYVLVGTLPKTSTGKIAAAELRARLDGEAVESRVRALNTWKYKRAQPSDVGRLRALLERSALWGEDISFVAYWGCGRRISINAADRTAMDRMCEYISRASFMPARARLTLILTDLHAIINGKPTSRVQQYFSTISTEAEERGLDTLYLSDLWASWNRTLSDLQPARVNHPLIDKATARALKHDESGDPLMAARRYIAACQWDSEVMSQRFPTSVFLTYNGPADSKFLPAMTTLYIYSCQKGVSSKPWFCDNP